MLLLLLLLLTKHSLLASLVGSANMAVVSLSRQRCVTELKTGVRADMVAASLLFISQGIFSHMVAHLEYLVVITYILIILIITSHLCQTAVEFLISCTL